MINLFEEKSIFIKKSGINLSPIFDIDSDEDISIIIPSVKNIEKITLNISGKGIINLLEIDEENKIKIEINLSKGAKLNHSIAFFKENNEVEYMVNLKENAEYLGALADFSIGNNKLNYVCNLLEEYAIANWHLASLACGNDIKNMSVSFYHYAKHTYAKMENYGVCENNASLSFLGTSSILKGAKASATHQNAKIMVFDENCKAKASPILCIDENDVEASHAAVVGQINEEHIFYLTSRGIEEEDAKKLITLGYLNPILRYFSDDSTLEKIKNSIDGRF